MKISKFAIVAVCVFGTVGFFSSAFGDTETATSSQNGVAALNFAKQAALQQATNKVKSFIPTFGEDAPDWAKRIELNWNLLTPGKSEQSILTVQPLYQSPGNKDTVFVQGSLLRYALYDNYRFTGNIGTGYRRLLLDDTVMLGANAFFDDEFTHGHRRASIGLEAKWNVLDFGFNDYIALTDDRVVDNAYEHALSGRDVRLATQMPYLPWLKIGGSYYWWDSENVGVDMNGSAFTASLALHPNLSVDYRWSSYDETENLAQAQSSVMLTFKLASFDSPTLTTGPIISDKVFEKRALSSETLTKVVRENRIIVERRTSGGRVIIARGN